MEGVIHGRPEVVREAVVPIFRGDQVVAIVGVGNKPLPYGEKDIEAIAGAPFRNGEGVYTSKMYFLKGHLGREDVVGIAEGALANTLIKLPPKPTPIRAFTSPPVTA